MSFLSFLFPQTDPRKNRIKAPDGFRIATQKELWGSCAPLVAAAASAPKSADTLLAYADQVKEAIARGATVPWGTRVAAVSHYWLGDCGELIGTSAARAYVAPFEEAYRRRPEPYTAVMLAEACFNVADSVRGENWSDATGEASMDLAHSWNVRGCEALMAQSDAVRVEEGKDCDPQHYPWYAQYYISATRLTRTLDDLNAAFQQVFVLDKTNLQLLREHGQELLPRWRGEDASTLDEFARWAVDQTKDIYARGAYAYIYGNLANIGEMDVGDTLINVDLLNAGYLDLIDRFPCVRLQNEHANAMSWADAEHQVLAAFNKGLRVIDYRAWGGDDEREGLQYALNAYTFARDNG